MSAWPEWWVLVKIGNEIDDGGPWFLWKERKVCVIEAYHDIGYAVN